MINFNAVIIKFHFQYAQMMMNNMSTTFSIFSDEYYVE